MSIVNTNINYCRLLAVSVDLKALTIQLSYVLGNLTNGVYSDHSALTTVGRASYPVAQGLTLVAAKAAIQAVEPNINFAAGDELVL